MAKRIVFWLKTQEIFYIVLMFGDNVDDHEPSRIKSRENFESDDYFCRGHILSTLDD